MADEINNQYCFKNIEYLTKYLYMLGWVFSKIMIVTFCHTVFMDGMTDMIKYMNSFICNY